MTDFFTMKSKKKLLKCLGFLSLMFLFSVGATAQTTVSGVVSDANGPIPGANVTVKGTKNSVATGFDGNYSIANVPSNGVLVFSFLGLKDKEIPVAGKNKINAVLEENQNNLQEVVVIGYGTQRKEAVTGSVSSIKGDVIREVPAANVTQALQGRLAGVQMNQTSSKPGAEMQIRIRGTRSLTADNNPLVVLDGVPFAGSIGDISPDNIKSIDILKDASATAIYGSRGANGVILISTNKGLKGQRAKFSYNTYSGLKTIFAKFPMMNGPEFVALRKAATLPGTTTPLYTNGVDEADNINTDWQDLMYGAGLVTNHDVGVSGGTENGNYNFGTSYYKEEAVVPGQDYSRITLRAAVDQAIGQYFKVGFTTNNNYSISNGANLSLYNTLSTTSIANPYNADGSLKRTVKMPIDENWVYTRDVIENLGDKWIDQTKAYSSYNTLYAEVKIPGVEGLKYHLDLGGNFRTTNGGQYTGEGVFNINPTTVSTASVTNTLNTNWTIQNLLTYDRTFGKHQVNAVAMYSAEQTTYNKSQISARDIPSDAFQFYNLGRAAGEISVNPDNQDYQQSGLVSYMARAMYSYDNRYMLTATVRSDASSRLAKGHQWHTYPAVSAGWNVKNEAFMQNVNWLEQLKLRVGYGETSNQAVAPYSTLGSLASRPYNFGETNATGYYVSTLPNPDLGWEYSTTMNYGVDFGFFKNRLTGTFEYYVTDTKDILLSVGLPPTAGVGSYTANIGQTQNKGYEFTLNGAIFDNPNGWSWDVGVNFYSNKNKLVALSSGQTRDENNWWFVGHPIDVIFDYEKVGLWQQGDANLTKYEPGGNVGMIKVKYTGDFNADGSPTRQIGPADRQIIDVNPDFLGGFNSRVAYKNLDLSVVGAFQSGGVLISTLYSSTGYLNMLSGRRGNVDVDYWTPENTDAKYPRPGGISSNDNPKYGSTLGYFDASYVKIRTITLGYNITEKFIKDLGVDRFRLYCTVQNPFVISSPYHRETGMDPETNSYGNENAAVTDFYKRRLLTLGTNTPSTRTFLLGLNLTF
ncbi:TonB-linked outer membrane protein, SusC/RagA family [Flavobacterium resistens]|uniref:SusC/RagA family TonB-linked outer membrane protein n=2 Tax=Flavobacterium resistens TaxID=443612 RepID=A0A521DM99_9FLAO|nr:SusC/RagA family TonB-linked outer membrane protein [Flavobacterium resistens]SMO72806.1 TonB-linked outer membrane protein, SusC/RagA family [Flavobacterium resistens]